jgi:hypothetical protein
MQQCAEYCGLGKNPQLIDIDQSKKVVKKEGPAEKLKKTG